MRRVIAFVLCCLACAPADDADTADTSVPLPATAAAPPPAAAADTGSFADFWTEFRAAALAGDTARVLALTAFPFAARGPGDADTTVTYDRAGFAELLARLLAQDPGLAPLPQTTRDLLERTPAPPPDAVRGAEARIGDLVFARVDGRWRFVRAYVEP